MNIVITGASKGIGKAIAEKYAEQGNTLFLCARNETHLFDLKDRIMARNKSAEVKYFSADLG
ncbi:MAG: SDR family NAD(P)-dependent oxidoreductase, partial [Ginsengibacter sp.]